MFKRTILVLVSLCIGFTFAHTGDSLFIKGEKRLERAYFNWSENDLISSRAFFERVLSQNERKWLARYYIALADYRLANYYSQKDEKSKGEKHIHSGIEHLEKSIELNPQFSDSHSLLASLYGLYIGYHPVKGMIKGPKIGNHFEKAREIGPGNYRVYLLEGIGVLFRPSFFGGGKENALKTFQEGLKYLESKKNTGTVPAWGRAEYHAWMGYVYLKADNDAEAEKCFKKALEEEPEYYWVSKHLLKQVKR